MKGWGEGEGHLDEQLRLRRVLGDAAAQHHIVHADAVANEGGGEEGGLVKPRDAVDARLAHRAVHRPLTHPIEADHADAQLDLIAVAVRVRGPQSAAPALQQRGELCEADGDRRLDWHRRGSRTTF